MEPTTSEELPLETPEEVSEPRVTRAVPIQTPVVQPQVIAVPAAITPDSATVPVVSAEPVEITPNEAPEVENVEAIEVIKAEAPVAEAPTLRPKTRPDRLPEQPRRKKVTQQGNSNQNTTAGSAIGSQTATATQHSGQTGQSSQAGNADASNYPGKVMRKISRIRKPRSRVRGTTVIRFAIAPSGALQSATVSQSSGSEQFDNAALQIVRRAAPFPAPPPGAQRNFSVKFSGQS